MLAAVVLWALGWSAAASADQRDSRLPALFAALAAARSDERAEQLEGRIWAIWLDSGRPGEVAETMRRGLAMLARGLPHDALRAFDVVVRLAPEFAEGWNKRATLRYGLGDLDGSAADIARTLSLEPRHFGALSGLGLVRLAQGRPAEALAAFEQALAIHPYVIDRDDLTALRDKVRGKPL